MDPNPSSSSSLLATQVTKEEEEKKKEEFPPLKDISAPQGISSSSSSLPIRAPPSDFDIETSVKINGGGGGGSGVSSIIDSDEEGFMSGEDDFDTASERPFVADPDEETLEKAMENEKIVPFHEASSNFSSTELTRPKAIVSGEDDDDVIDEEEDEGFVSEVDDDVVVRVPPVVGSGGVFDGEKGEEDEDEVLGSEGINNPVLDLVSDGGSGVTDAPAEKNLVVEEDKVLVSEGNNPVSVSEEPFEDGGSGATDAPPAENLVVEEDEVLGSEGNNPVSVSEEPIGDGGSGVTDAPPAENLVVEKEDILPENPIPEDVVVATVVDKLEEEVTETENGSVVEKKIDVPVTETEDGSVVEKKIDVPMTETEDGSVVEKKIDVPVVEQSITPSSTIGGDDSIVDTEHSIEVDANGVSDVKEVEGSVDETEVLGGGDDQASSLIEESTGSELVQADNDEKSSSEGGSLVETKPLGLEATVTEEVEDKKVDDIKVVEPVVERSISLENESEQATVVVEEPVVPKVAEAVTNIAKAEEENGVEHDDSEHVANDSVVETPKPEHQESKLDEAEVEKNVDEKSGVVVDGLDHLDLEEPETEPQTDSVAKPNESILTVAADGVESESRDGVVSKDETPVTESNTASAELDSVLENKSHVLAAEDSNLVEGSDAFVTAQDDESKAVASSDSNNLEAALPSSVLDSEVKQEDEDEEDLDPDYEYEGSGSDEDTNGIMFDGSETAEQIMRELEQGVGSQSGGESSQDRFQRIDGEIVMDSDEEVDTDEEDGKELFDSAALAALLKAATSAGSDGGSVTITSPDGSKLFSVDRPAGLGSSIRSLKPLPRPNRPGAFTPSDLSVGGESEKILTEEEKQKLEKIQLIRVKFLRLVQRLGHSPDDSIAAQVLYRLVLAAGRHTSQTFSIEAAKRTAMLLEAEGKDDLDFSLNILVLGKTGVGKSATINSIFGVEKAPINPFEPGTTTVKEIVGEVDGVKIRVFDTPGLKSSGMDQSSNRKALASVKKLVKNFPPDILLYVDRLDTQSRDLNDLPLLKSITAALGSSIWRSAIVTLTHAASAPPDGPTGSPLSYEMFVAQRSNVVQQSIGQAVGDLRMMNPSLMNPVSLVENHPSCRRNREGHRVLPNGQSWRPQLLLLCYSMKILSEASSLSKPQDPFDHRKLFGFRTRSPPLPYLLSSLLQSRAHPKLPTDQGGESVDSDVDLEDLADSDQEEEDDEYEQLPPFKPLKKYQIDNLSKEQKKAYFEEYDYRVKLLQKKQWREELKRMREMKKKGPGVRDDSDYMGEDVDQENEGPAAVPVPLPDMILPATFDGDNPAYRYRFLEPSSQLLARPVLDTHGWDHDCGYDGVSLEESLALASKFPAVIAAQITKDKKEFNIHLDSCVAAKLGENGSTLAGFDIQTIGKQLAYVVRGETKFKNLKKNNPAAGASITFLGENVATGFKVEDQIAVGKHLVLVGSTGTVRSQGDAAYGANLEARLRQKDFPIDQDQSTLGLSLMRWRGDLALGANLQSQLSVGRLSKMSLRVGLNNKMSGQITVKTNTSDQLQIALVGILPIAISIYRTICPGAGEIYPAY